MDRTSRSVWKAIGPGVLFAGAAVGVSHLVQSTRAGADFGLGLVLVVVLANVLKYAAFRFGPQYAAATGTSLLEGYRRQGGWALLLYALMTVGTMFTVLAVVTVVTAGLAIALLGLPVSAVPVSGVLIAVCAALLAGGGYRWLDRVIKLMVVVLSLSTIAATVLVAPSLEWNTFTLFPHGAFADPREVAFVVALVGWMPSAIDVSVWQSLWTLARRDDTGHAPSVTESMVDFHMGYLGTAALALCFVALGAAVMHGHGITFQASASGFASQVIALYTHALGGWSRPLIGTAAFTVMFSTTLTVVDGFPRALAVLASRLQGPERGVVASRPAEAQRLYWASLVILSLGAMAVLLWATRSLTVLVDLATTLSFLTAPVLAWLNHRAVLGDEVPAAYRPGPGLQLLSLLGIVFLGGFALYFLWVRFVA